jgi:hypothetical protein
MANGINAPYGLVPISSITGGAWGGKTNNYYIYAPADGVATYATNIFTGDPVIFNPTIGTINKAYPTIALYPINNASVAAATTSSIGVFMGCEYYPANDPQYLKYSNVWPASTAVKAGSVIIAKISDDPATLYRIQASTSTNVLNNARFGSTNNAPATLAYFGQNYAFGLGGGGANLIPNNPATGNLNNGLSAVYLNVVDTSGAANVRTTVTLPLKAIAFANPGNILDPADATGATTLPFLDIIVSLNNHSYRAGSLGITPA